MKLEELNIKVITGNEVRNKTIQAEFNKKGGRYFPNTINSNNLSKFNALAIFITHEMISITKDIDIFLQNELTETPFDDAIEMINNLEDPQPEFDIKQLQDVLVRDDIQNVWYLHRFIRTDNIRFIADNNRYTQLIPFKGNETLILTNTNVTEWWEVEDGEEILKREKQINGK